MFMAGLWREVVKDEETDEQLRQEMEPGILFPFLR